MAPAISESPLDNILEAMRRAWPLLPGEAQRKLHELTDTDTLLALAVLLAIWGGFQFTPLGPLADAALALYGSYKIGGELGSLVAAIMAASRAQTDQDLTDAGQEIATAFSDTVVDVVAAILGNIAFGTLRKAVKGLRGRNLPAKVRPIEEPLPESIGETARLPAPRRSIEVGKPTRVPVEEVTANPVVGGAIAVGVGNAAVDIPKVLPQFRWGWAVGGLVGVGLLVTAITISSRMRRQSVRYG